VATNPSTQSPLCSCGCPAPLSSALQNNIAGPVQNGTIAKTENGTIMAATAAYYSYSTDKTDCLNCSSIPRLGSSLSLKWIRLGGQPAFNSAYDDQWMPAGNGGVFSFLPRVSDLGAPTGGQVVYSEEGRISFDSANAIQEELPIVAFRDATTYFTTYNQETGVYFEYFGGNLASFDQNYGRLNRRYDTNGNVLQYQYGTSSGGNNLLRTMTGDLGPNVSPYFYYANESFGLGSQGCLTKVFLHDLAVDQNSRTVYFEYTSYTNPLTFDNLPMLSKVVNPTGCTQLYDPVIPFNDVTEAYQLKREVDAEGYVTYFNYTGATLNQVAEPEGRIVYYDYSVFGETHQIPQGRNKRITLYDVSNVGDQMFLPKRDTDALGNTTYFGYDSTLQRIVQQVDPNANITYYRYVGGSAGNKYAMTLKLSAFNQAQTYFGYAPGAYDMVKQVGPRQTSTFSQTTYYQYDGSRNRTAMVDALGNTTLSGRDGFGHLSRLDDARGNTTYYNYSTATGDMDSMSDALGNTAYYGYSSFRDMLREVSPRWPEKSFASFTTYYEYDGLSRWTKTVDPLLNVTYFDWTARSLMLDTVDARGTTTAYTYNGLKLVTQKTVTNKAGTQLTQEKYGYDIYKNRTKLLDARLDATYFYFDQIDRLTAQVDALKDGTYYFYDSVGNRTVLRDARGNPAYYFYDLLSRNTVQRDAQGNATYFFYDLSNNRSSAVNALGNPAYYFYDQLDRLQATRDAQANPTYYFYDPVGNRSVLTDARFDSTYYFYDADNRNNVLRDALGNLTYYSYDAKVNRTKVIDARSNATSSTYDPLDRLSIALDAISNPTYFGYDAVGNNTQLMDARFNTTYYFYDGLNRNTVVKDALADLTYYFYDATSNRTVIRNPNLHSTYFKYDAINRLTAVQDALGNTTYFEFDAVSNPTKVLDPDLHVTLTRYDTLNRPDAIRFADTGSVYYLYDAVSNRIKDVDPLGKATYYGYDTLNRATKLVDALWRTVYFEYDAVSNLSKELGAEGESSVYTYDALNRRTNIAYTAAGAVVAASLGPNPYFVYDQVSNLTQMGDLWGLHLLGYDAANRLARYKYPNASVVYYEYDPAWNVTTVAYPGASGRSGAGYDAVNRQTRVQAPSGATAYFAYDMASNQTQRFLGNSAKLDVSYDAVERVQNWRNSDKNKAPLTYFDYTRDAKGLITKAVREATYTTYYTYDANDRLASEVWAKTGATPSEVYGYRYAYDLAGNRLKQKVNGSDTYYFYDKANQLTVKGTTSAFASPTYYIYDKNGSLTNLVPRGSAATYFAYNAAGLVARIKWQDASATYFFYDGALRRYGMNANGTMTYFLWNGPNLLQELNLDGTVKEEHTNAMTPIAGIAQLVETNRPGQAQQKIYPIMDMRGTITKWIQSDGSTVFASREYDAFGTIIPNSGAGAWPGRFGYQGQAWIEITSNDGTQKFLISPTRIYDSSIGLFLQRDPLLRHTLTKRELKNDFIDFNSVSRRYYFPARLFTPFRGEFAQAEPLLRFMGLELLRKRQRGRWGLDSLYVYVNANVTRLVDPLGLQESGSLPTSVGDPYHAGGEPGGDDSPLPTSLSGGSTSPPRPPAGQPPPYGGTTGGSPPTTPPSGPLPPYSDPSGLNANCLKLCLASFIPLIPNIFPAAWAEKICLGLCTYKSPDKPFDGPFTGGPQGPPFGGVPEPPHPFKSFNVYRSIYLDCYLKKEPEGGVFGGAGATIRF
jgi:YD repeat-containing protein